MAGGRCARAARFCLLPGSPSLSSLIHQLGDESSPTRRMPGRPEVLVSGVIGNLADLGAVLLRLDDGPLRKQAVRPPATTDIAGYRTGGARHDYRLIGGHSVVWRQPVNLDL